MGPTTSIAFVGSTRCVNGIKEIRIVNVDVNGIDPDNWAFRVALVYVRD